MIFVRNGRYIWRKQKKFFCPVKSFVVVKFAMFNDIKSSYKYVLAMIDRFIEFSGNI